MKIAKSASDQPSPAQPSQPSPANMQRGKYRDHLKFQRKY